MVASKIDDKKLYRRRGHTYNRICYVNGIAVYEVFFDFVRIGYEVCKMSINKHPKADKPSMMTPGDEQWGADGFTCLTLPHAFKYVNRLAFNHSRIIKGS